MAIKLVRGNPRDRARHCEQDQPGRIHWGFLDLMLDRDRGHNAQVGGLTLGLALLGLYALLAISVSWVNSTHALQGQAEQHAAAQCQEGKDCDEKALRLQARELVTAEATFDLAVYQSIFNFVGVLGLGVTVFYAHRAWREAQRSADAAHDSLDDARRDAGEQAARFEAQLRIANENLRISRRSATEVDRAWLSVEVVPISGLRIDDETVSIEARVAIKNVGKGPAIGVEWTGELTLNPSDLDREIRRSPGLRILSGRFGEIMFPGKEIVWEGPFSVDRKALIDAIAEDLASAEPVGVYPTMATGARYSLPGDDTRRMTYIYLSLAKRAGAKMGFDDGDTSFNLADLTWRSDILTGPVT